GGYGAAIVGCSGSRWRGWFLFLIRTRRLLRRRLGGTCLFLRVERSETDREQQETHELVAESTVQHHMRLRAITCLFWPAAPSNCTRKAERRGYCGLPRCHRDLLLRSDSRPHCFSNLYAARSLPVRHPQKDPGCANKKGSRP